MMKLKLVTLISYVTNKMITIEINSIIKDIPVHDYFDCIVNTIDFSDIKYNDFLENMMLKNLPCIVKNISCEWECNKNWIKDDQINYDYFSNTYSDIEAPVADCDKIDYNAHCKCHMKINEYMEYLNNQNKEKTLYLKDWHLRRIRPSDNFYNVPFIFGSDWLNEYAEDHSEDDFMFVYIGPSNSWTPFHADVYSSYSWSVNIFGKKKWILLPPCEEEKLRDSLGNLPLVFNPEQFDNVKYFEVIQEKGDAIFVPSGWHHQVTNIVDTISINHNFINACNIELVWNSLQKNLLSVEEEIYEFRDTPEFKEQCQLILKSVFGMNFNDFLKFILHIAQKRINQIKCKNYLGFNNFCLGIKHIMFDLNIILKIINLVQNHTLFSNNYIQPEEKATIIDVKRSILEVTQE